MGRPRQVTDEQILAAARRCLLERGPGVPSTEIARRLGISHGVLFQRFGTKDDLIRAALVPSDPAWIAEIAGGPDAKADLRAQLLALACRIHADFQENVPRVALLRAMGVPARHWQNGPHRLAKAHRALAAWLERARAGGRIRRAARPDHVAYLLLGAIQSRAFIAHMSREALAPEDTEAYLRTVVDLVWRALRTAP